MTSIYSHRFNRMSGFSPLKSKEKDLAKLDTSKSVKSGTNKRVIVRDLHSLFMKVKTDAGINEASTPVIRDAANTLKDVLHHTLERLSSGSASKSNSREIFDMATSILTTLSETANISALSVDIKSSVMESIVLLKGIGNSLKIEISDHLFGLSDRFRPLEDSTLRLEAAPVTSTEEASKEMPSTPLSRLNLLSTEDKKLIHKFTGVYQPSFDPVKLRVDFTYTPEAVDTIQDRLNEYIQTQNRGIQTLKETSQRLFMEIGPFLPKGAFSSIKHPIGSESYERARLNIIQRYIDRNPIDTIRTFLSTNQDNIYIQKIKEYHLNNEKIALQQADMTSAQTLLGKIDGSIL